MVIASFAYGGDIFNLSGPFELNPILASQLLKLSSLTSDSNEN